MAAQTTALPFFPLALRRSQKARMTGVSGGEKPPKSGGEPNQGEPQTKKGLRNAGPLSWLMAKTMERFRFRMADRRLLAWCRRPAGKPAVVPG